MTDDKDKGMHPLTAAVIGAAVGAAAVALSDKNKREKLRQKANMLMDKSKEQLDVAKQKVDQAKEQGRDKLADSLNEASKSVRKTKTEEK
jgi:gas vesicle protein